MEEKPSEDSVRDWMDRARRAHDLLDRLNLDGVADHDPEAIEKLSKVTIALEQLSEGRNVEYVPGVDENEAPTLDEHQIRRSELLAVLSKAGLGDRLGRVFLHGAVEPTTALDLIPHRDGLPDFDVCIAPDHTPAEGAQGIFVSQRGVFAALIPEPVTRHKWRILRSRPFDDHGEMLETVKRFMCKTAE